MDIIKKNILSFICAIVAIIALVASFWPMGGQYAGLQADLQERKGVYDTADRLIKKERLLPTVDPKESSKQVLEVFPSDDVIDKGNAAVEQVDAESQKMVQTAVEINRHKLLVDNSLPEPSDLAIFQFVQQYKSSLNDHIPNEILNAGAPPSQEEIQKAADELWQKNYAADADAAGAAGAGGRAGDTKALQDQFNAEVEKLPEQIQQRIATEKKIYLDPLALDAAKSMDSSKPNADQIWYAQVGLWVQEDVAGSLAAANAQAKNILDAPVKRLIKLDVVEQQDGMVYTTDKSVAGSRGGGRGAAATPGMMGGRYSEPEPAPAAGGAVPRDFTISHTGRASSSGNTLYDVVHFKLELVIDAASIAQVIEELQRNKLVTVLQIDELTGVDAALDQSEGYIYGDRPVVRVALLCEALFLRDWTVELMPQRVKQLLNIQPPAGADATASTR